MGKTIYTERDIEDLAQQGVHSLVVTEEMLLTGLAVEKATQLGITLENRQAAPPSGPVRPYLVSKPQGKTEGRKSTGEAFSANGAAQPASSPLPPASAGLPAAIPSPARDGAQPVEERARPQKNFPEPVLAPIHSQPNTDLRQRIFSAVSAKLGGELDPTLLERLISRILDNIETK